MYILKSKFMRIIYPDGRRMDFDIIKDKSWTPTGQCVDYGEYYEIACYSHYKRINKETMEVTSDRKDVSQFLPENDYKAEIIKV